MDICSKARLSKQRRSVRSQLVAAPLIVAQTGLERVRRLLSSGDPSVMEGLKLTDHYSVAEVLQYLCRAPFTLLMKLFDRVKGDDLEAQLLGLAADLDFSQSVLDLVSSKEALNPALNAVAEAFKRRALCGSFVSDTHCIALDALKYADTRGDNDQDGLATDIKSMYDKNKKQRRGDKATPNICWPYQRGICRWKSCRFAHICSLCGMDGHGSTYCGKRSSLQKLADQALGVSLKTEAPNPRRRTDRT